jgi:radical SAM superfamily enzyme YgiQ (UPF0313 family)
MRILFISASTEQINMPTLPLGLVCVATATEKAGHDVKVVDLVNQPDARMVIRKALEEFRPDVIGISVRNIDDQSMKDTKFLLDQVREVVADSRSFSDAPIVLGGAGYSIYPEASLAYVGADVGIQGEGERAFPALIARIQERTGLAGIPGLYLPGRGLQCPRYFAQDLDELPLPDTNLWRSCNLNFPELWIPFPIKRGCPMNCSYCSTPAIEGNVIRRRSPGAIVEGIARHVEAGFRRFYFTDNIFNIPSDYAREICRSLIAQRLGISWMSILYPEKIDEGLIKDMARAGCSEVSLGFESGSEQILGIMNKRYKTEDVRQTSKLLADYGIRQTGFLLLGGPGETRESVEASLVFADSLPLDTVKVTVGIRIYPNTALAKRAVDERIITPDDNLLLPRFYLVRGLEDWLYETVKDWMAERPHWVI